MSERAKRWGSITLLSGLGGSIVALALSWVFATTFKNTVMFTPLVSAIEKLNHTVEKQEDKNRVEHNMIVKQLQTLANQSLTNQLRLEAVIADCNENSEDIDACRSTHSKGVTNVKR